ncbi:MAG TPA: MotA/TolQ/ExbB proton channel family protein [Chryseolinea sp.]|nr:MotA/TolQ/ExbB proton channel family protein [Chryseolinea sp.]
MSLSETYVQGGVPFMHPITLTFIANLIVIVMVIIKLIQKKDVDAKWTEAIKHLGGFALVLGAFGTIMGFYFAFSDLERMTETLPLSVISGGVKVALITVLYGLIVHVISLLAYILIKLFGKTQ